ncbi:MAG: ribokinase [Mobilitalea sp.]
MKILNFGSINIDHVYQIPHFLKPGETLASTQYQCFPGGKGLNQSIALAKAGSYVYHAGKVGSNAELVMKALQEGGVDTSLINKKGTATGHAIIQVDPKGENCILLYGGSNLEITTQDMDTVLTAINEEYILVLQNEISNLEYLLQKAAKAGVKVALNPSPIDEKLKTLDFSGVTWLILNETEGLELSGESQSEKIIEKLSSKYPELKIILTLGEKGAIYKDKDTEYTQPIFPAKVKDTTAAGDTFSGYFISAVAEGIEVQSALKMAAMASSITVSREGASISIPTRDEVVSRLQELN